MGDFSCVFAITEGPPPVAGERGFPSEPRHPGSHKVLAETSILEVTVLKCVFFLLTNCSLYCCIIIFTLPFKATKGMLYLQNMFEMEIIGMEMLTLDTDAK